MRCRFALKSRETTRVPAPKPKYHECREEDRNEMNNKLKQNMNEAENQSDENKQDIFKEAMKEITKLIPTKTPSSKDTHYSAETEQILRDCKAAVENGNIDKFAQLTKQFRKKQEGGQTTICAKIHQERHGCKR